MLTYVDLKLCKNLSSETVLNKDKFVIMPGEHGKYIFFLEIENQKSHNQNSKFKSSEKVCRQLLSSTNVLKHKGVKYDLLSLPMINAAIEHLRMQRVLREQFIRGPRLLEGAVYFTFSVPNAVLIAGRCLKEEIRHPIFPTAFIFPLTVLCASSNKAHCFHSKTQ